jgi:hypothetical protein
MDEFFEKITQNENNNRLNSQRLLMMEHNWLIRMMKFPLQLTLRNQLIIILYYDEKLNFKNLMM